MPYCHLFNMSDPYFFGYGSLVNLATHVYSDPHAAKISGWRRTWTTTNDTKFALLNIQPFAENMLLGMIAGIPDSNWCALDQRELGYHRQDVTDVVFSDKLTLQSCSVYVVSKPAKSIKEKNSPILLTYLDVVLQGFLQIYGERGPKEFFATTDSWDRPVLDDRKDPRYPRHQRLRKDETAMVNDLLKEHSLHPIKSL